MNTSWVFSSRAQLIKTTTCYFNRIASFGRPAANEPRFLARIQIRMRVLSLDSAADADVDADGDGDGDGDEDENAESSGG